MVFKSIKESILLYEDIESVKRQYSHVPDDEFEEIIRLDPTFDESRNSVGKYGKWLLGLYNKDNPLQYNSNTVFELLKEYDKYKNDRKYEIEKDINKFKSLADMTRANADVKNAELSNRQLVRERQKNKDYDIVYQDEDWAIFVPNTWEAAVNLGKGTSWCTADSREEAGKKYYNQYLQYGGKYYILINKHNKYEKYQFHFETNQFMNYSDEPIAPTDICNNSMREFFKQEGYNVDDYGQCNIDDVLHDIILNSDGLFEDIAAVMCEVEEYSCLAEISEEWIPYLNLFDIISNGGDAEIIYDVFLGYAEEFAECAVDILAKSGWSLSADYYDRFEFENAYYSDIKEDVKQEIFERLCKYFADYSSLIWVGDLFYYYDLSTAIVVKEDSFYYICPYALLHDAVVEHLNDCAYTSAFEAAYDFLWGTDVCVDYTYGDYFVNNLSLAEKVIYYCYNDINAFDCIDFSKIIYTLVDELFKVDRNVFFEYIQGGDLIFVSNEGNN